MLHRRQRSSLERDLQPRPRPAHDYMRGDKPRTDAVAPTRQTLLAGPPTPELQAPRPSSRGMQGSLLLCRERFHDCGVEPRRLIGPENGAHRKDVLQRLFLQFAHRLVRTIDGGGDLRAIAMLGLDRLGQPRIIRAQLGLQRLSANGIVILNDVETGALRVIDLQIAMPQLIEFRLNGTVWHHEHPDEPPPRHSPPETNQTERTH